MSLAIVTGGSRGIGAAIAEKLAQDGFDVLINCASSVEKAEAVAEKCRAHGVNAYVKKWDVADYDACSTALKEIKEEIGVPFVLVNNAGITRDGLMVRMKEDQFDDVIRTNLKGAFNMLSLCGAMMMRAKQGRIINITSVSAFTGNYGQINYTAAKAGMVGMTKTAAKELGARGITVNAVAPGWIATEMSDKVPEDIRENAKKQIDLRQVLAARQQPSGRIPAQRGLRAGAARSDGLLPVLHLQLGHRPRAVQPQRQNRRHLQDGVPVCARQAGRYHQNDEERRSFPSADAV